MFRIAIPLFAAATVLTVSGCGGESALTRIDGVYTGSANVTRNTNLKLDLEMTVVGGSISGALRLVDNGVVRTATLSGEAVLDGVTFRAFFDDRTYGEADFSGIFIAGQITGNYQRKANDIIQDSGSFVIARVAEQTANPDGSWSGSFTVTEGPGVGGTWGASLQKVGNRMTGNGAAMGMNATIKGTVIGRQIDLTWLNAENRLIFEYNGLVEGDFMTGTWTNPEVGNRGAWNGNRQSAQ
ncbi:MAG: hypothetical protein ACK4XJ_04265 [Fimbriimonadaceae bacterium]